MRIGIDIDNTISSTRETILAYLQRHALDRGLPFNFDPYQYTLEEALPWEPGEMEIFVTRYLADIYREVLPKPHAVEVIRELHRQHFIALITSRNRRNGNIQAVTMDWLSRHGLEYDQLIMNETENLHHFSKLSVCLDNHIEVMIEDHHGLSLELSQFIPVVLFDYPYNTHLQSDNIIRVYRWLDVKPALAALSRRHFPSHPSG